MSTARPSTPPQGAAPVPRPHQSAALDALTYTFAVDNEPRAQVVMPCGSGKTLLGRWLARNLHARTTVVFVPTLPLLTQTLRTWRTETTDPFDALIVCSDKTAGRTPQDTQDSLNTRLTALPGWASTNVKATTNRGVLTRHITTHNRSRPLVVFSTYHSAPTTAKALRDANRPVDLVVCDEAHRLAGQPWDHFRVALDDKALPATRRVFMTATPKAALPVDPALLRDDHDHTWNTRCLSMTDPTVFGPVVYTLDHTTAVSTGILADYDVHVLTHVPDAGTAAMATTASLDHDSVVTATHTALNDGATRLLSFHNRVKDAAALAAALDGSSTRDGRQIRAIHLSAKHTTTERTHALSLLADPPNGTAVLIASARLLGEGIDVPDADTAIFAAPRTSPVDIAQIVGRIMRPTPHKTRGRVVIPVTIPDHQTADDASALAAGPFAHVWTILRALADSDSRFHQTLTALPSRRGHRTRERTSQPRLFLDLPAGWDTHDWELRTVDKALSGWGQHYDRLTDWARTHGHARPARPVTHDGYKIGLWVAQQRSAWAKGTLPAHLAVHLETLPGWAWTTKDAAWWNVHDQYQAAALAGHAQDPDFLDQARTGAQGNGTLWRWATRQRHEWRQNNLPQARVDALESIPGWAWEPVQARDAAMIDALIEYNAWKGNPNPPADYVHDQIPYRDTEYTALPLGKWVRQVRRAHLTGTLDKALHAELDTVSAVTGTTTRFDMAARDTSWNVACAALRQYVAREGKVAGMPEHHVETLQPENYDVNLQYWVRAQRHRHRTGKLDPLRVDILTRVQGWVWEVPRADRIKIDVGDRPHGTRRAYAAGCLCDDCTAANTAENAQREARRRNGLPATLLVDAARARGHVRILEGRGAGQKQMARAAAVNVKTIVELLDGTLKRIHPETEKAVLALTLDAAHAQNKPGRHGPTVPAGPTLALIEKMKELGWSAAWIAREAGYVSGAIQIDPDATEIPEKTAARYQAVWDRLDGRHAPPRQHRAPQPSLDQLDQAARARTA